LGLAVWSNREFLVLGPSLGDRQTTKRSDAIRISVDFGNDPSETNCARLIGAGVAWFIVDTRLTNLRDWSPCARKVHQVEDFLVLSLSAKRPGAMDQ